MSLFGWINDAASGNASGTADQQAADIAALQAKLKAQDDARLASGDITPDQYALLVDQPALTQSDAPNTLGAAASIVGAGAAGAAGALLTPGATFGAGSNWLANWIKTQLVAWLKQIPWYVWLAGAVGLFFWLGGGGFLTRAARRKLST